MNSPNSAAAPATAAIKTQTAIFGLGCFWSPELKFSQVPGVLATDVGYAGGHVKNPTYQQVCTDTTGHAEVVQITFDPAKVSYAQLIDLFFEIHDPTQVNRQGPDVGGQYRTVVFYTSDEQKAAVEAAKAKLESSGKFRRKIATSIEPAGTFYKAEEYHQDYLKKRGLDTCAPGH